MANQIVRGNLFDDFFNDIAGLAPGYFVRPMQQSEKMPSSSQIRIDVKEDNDAYTVHAELPGVSKEEINVSIDGNVVSLRTETKQEKEVKEGEKVLRSERFYGVMARTFQLPQDIDQTKSKAKYEQGVLTLVLPKKQASGSQRLSIE
jgi:HSP20 family protein